MSEQSTTSIDENVGKTAYVAIYANESPTHKLCRVVAVSERSIVKPTDLEIELRFSIAENTVQIHPTNVEGPQTIEIDVGDKVRLLRADYRTIHFLVREKYGDARAALKKLVEKTEGNEGRAKNRRTVAPSVNTNGG